MQPISLINQIPLPKQELKKLSFCSSNKVSRVAEWANYLRPTQFQQTSALLYQALPEINKLKASAQNRFEILEILRPYVQSTIVGLSKQFLHQPIALPTEAQKSVIIAQALQKHMIDGYLIVIRDAISTKKAKPAELVFFAAALHRAITGIGLVFLRSYQIYAQAPRGLWLSMHSLFRIADQYDLLDTRIADDNQAMVKVSTIQSAYLQTALLASARPHQLSQNDVRAIYDVFAEWAEYVRFELDLSDDPDCFYYVNLDKDSGPLYKSRCAEDEVSNLKIELKLNVLLGQLAKQTGDAIEEVGASVLKVPKEITKPVLHHLLDAWGNIAQRKQERRSTQITAELCIGLSDCHYYLSNGVNFENFTNIDSRGSAIPNSSSSGFTPKDVFDSDNGADSDMPPITRVEVQNTSQGGYCLLWKSTTPLKVQSGDVVSVKELGKRSWVIGVVRWIRQKKQSSQLGVQVLAEKVQPYAVAQNYDMGGYSDYMRALYIPASPFTDSPECLIIPSAPFQPMDRVKVLDGDDVFEAKLDEQLFATRNVQQLSFRRISGAKQTNRDNGSKSSW